MTNIFFEMGITLLTVLGIIFLIGCFFTVFHDEYEELQNRINQPDVSDGYRQRQINTFFISSLFVALFAMALLMMLFGVLYGLWS